LVLAAKVFSVREERNLPLVASKLKDFKLEQEIGRASCRERG